MKEDRRSHCALAIGKDIVVFGGRDSNDKILSSIEYFDWNTRDWTKKGYLDQPMFYFHLLFNFIATCNLIRYGATGAVVDGAAYGLKFS